VWLADSRVAPKNPPPGVHTLVNHFSLRVVGARVTCF
jgi:hypothetical protein